MKWCGYVVDDKCGDAWRFDDLKSIRQDRPRIYWDEVQTQDPVFVSFERSFRLKYPTVRQRGEILADIKMIADEAKVKQWLKQNEAVLK